MSDRKGPARLPCRESRLRRPVVEVPDGGGTWLTIAGSSWGGRRLFVAPGADPAGSWETLVVSLARLVVVKRLRLPFRLVAVV